MLSEHQHHLLTRSASVMMCLSLLALMGCPDDSKNNPSPSDKDMCATCMMADASSDQTLDQGTDQGMDQTIDQAMDQKPDQQIDMNNDLSGDDGGDIDEMSLEWMVSLDANITIQTATPKVVMAQATRDIAALSQSTWALTSKTVANHDCGALLQNKTDRSVTIVLPGDGDVRCADELTLTYELSINGDTKRAMSTVTVVPTPGRVTGFQQMANNPQPNLPPCPTWDCLNHADPTLGRLPTGELAVWFAAGGSEAVGKPVVGRAVQQAQGWVVDAAPVMTPNDAGPSAWDTARETPSVRWNAAANAWDMWYLGYNQSYFDDPAIGQTQSTDAAGTMWTRPPTPIYRPREGQWDEDFLTSPGAVLGSDGVWRLYYAGASFKINNGWGNIGLLTSQDGKTWTPHQSNPVFTGAPGQWDASILDPHVQFVGGRYVMWYSALEGSLGPDTPLSVGVATSEDGVTWQRVGQTPIISPIPNSWMDFRVLDVEVLPQTDGSLLMVGYATSKTSPNPNFPDFKPGRIGFWSSP